MNEIHYNKLVRDRIPDIIQGDNKSAVIRNLSGQELNKSLVDKLFEEGQEFLDALNIEELADILEVFHGLLDANNIAFQDVEITRLNKKEIKGGFTKGIFLEYVIE